MKTMDPVSVFGGAQARPLVWCRGMGFGARGLLRSTIPAFVALTLTLGCHQPKESPPAPSAQVSGETVTFPANSPQAGAIATEPVQPATPGSVRLTGRLVWDEDATVRIFSVLEGRVTRTLAPVGEKVEQDAPLALIASPDFGQVQADAAKSALDLRLAEQTLNRLKELAADGATPAKDLRAAEIDFARAQGEAQRTARRLQLYGGNVPSGGDHEFALRSPLAGVVVEKNINPGQSVRPDQMTANAPPLFVVTDPTRLWVLLDATEQDLSLLKIGAAVVIRTPTFPNETFEARVQSIADAIDPNSRTIKVRATVANPARHLKAEMFLTAELATPAPAGVEVPASAVFLKGDRHFVFVERAAGSFQRREVKIGTEHDGRLVVIEGLAVGEKVVREGAVILDQIVADNAS